MYFLHTNLDNFGAGIIVLLSTFWICVACFGGTLEMKRGFRNAEWRFWGLAFVAVHVVTMPYLFLINHISYTGQVWATFVYVFIIGSITYSLFKQAVIFNKIRLPVRVTTPKSEEQVEAEGDLVDSDDERNAKLYSWKKNPDWKVLVYYDKNTREVYHRWTLPDVTTVREAFRLQWEGMDFEEEY